MDRQLKVIAFFLLFIFFFIPQMSRGETFRGQHSPSDPYRFSGPAPERSEALHELCFVKRGAATHDQIGQSGLFAS